LGTVAENYIRIRAEIDAAAVRAGREPASVRLIAVSKTQPAEAVVEAAGAGAAIMGENRVQEALSKMEALSEMDGGADLDIEWHMIGTLQKNKARHVVGKFSMIHSLDSTELAAEIDRRAAVLGIVQEVLIEVNVAGEDTKHGVKPEDALTLAVCANGMENIRPVGLMCIPPFTDNPEDSRPHYRRLRELMEEIRDAGVGLRELSMGMTQDYEVAVEEGSTLVRVGTAIFGPRRY
jgi:hypothetical protein